LSPGPLEKKGIADFFSNLLVILVSRFHEDSSSISNGRKRDHSGNYFQKQKRNEKKFAGCDFAEHQMFYPA